MKKMMFAAAFAMLTSSVASAQVCFNRAQVRNFSVVNSSSLTVDAGRKTYLVDVFFCRELLMAEAIDFDTFGGSGFQICQGDKVLVVDPFTNRVVDSCTIRDITEQAE